MVNYTQRKVATAKKRSIWFKDYTKGFTNLLAFFIKNLKKTLKSTILMYFYSPITEEMGGD